MKHSRAVASQSGSIGIGNFDPSTGAFSLIDISTVIAPYWNYCGGVLAPDGLIYFVPHLFHPSKRFPSSTSLRSSAQ
jgi:hypothetical protein